MPLPGDDVEPRAHRLLPGEQDQRRDEADLIGPESKRQVPANHKVTFPLMTVLRDGRYVGLIWDHQPRFCALFDCTGA